MHRFMLTAAVLLLGQGAAMAADVVVNPHVTTDRSVDTRTVATIVASLVKPGMSEQDKAIAIYQFVRRTMFHYRTYPRYGGGGATNLINGVGYCLCTPTAGAQAELCDAAGLKGAILGTPGHGSVDVRIGDRWCWLDAFLGACVWDKDRKQLATLDEVFADPSLLKRDNPSPVDLFPCRDVLYADSLRFEPDNEKYHSECAPDDFAWAARAKPGERSPTYWKSSMTLDITLRPGERYIREWDNTPGMYFLHNTQDRFGPPHHFCGIEAEQRDTANWPYFKPYVREIASFDPKTKKETTVKTGRYWANGVLVWSPDLGSLDAFSRAENVKSVNGEIVPADASKPGVVELTVRCPYMLVGGKIGSGGPLGDSKLAFSISPDRNRGDKSTGKEPELPFVPLLFSPEKAVAVGDLRPVFAREMGTRGYRLRIEIAPGGKLPAFEIETIFQHNMYALPQLMPGRNEVKVEVANPEALAKTKFVVEFGWDGPDGKQKADRRAIDKSPCVFTIDIPEGGDLPRMRRLVMENGKSL